MSTALPIPRQTRQAILAASNVQTVFGPLDFPLFDEDDVQVWAKATGAASFTLIDTADYAVEAVTTFPGLFTVEFTDPPLPIAGGTIWIKGARLHKRETDVTQGGIVNSLQIEREFDRETVVLQELRRDVDALTGGTLPSEALASGIANDSNVEGGTVKDALETLQAGFDAIVENQAVDVFLWAGQSNAVGQGSAASSPTVPTGKVLQYKAAAGTISDCNDPMGDGPNAASTGSAGPAFGLAYYYGGGTRVCLLPSAVSGSAQQAALDPSNNWDAAGDLYDQSVANVEAGMAALTAAGYIPTFKGIIWCQGETDAASPAGYQAALEAMIARYRAEFGATIPFYISLTGTINPDSVGFQTVRAAQLAVAAADPHTRIVFYNAYDFVGRGLQSSDPHYDQAGLNEMGRFIASNIMTRQDYGGSHRISELSNFAFGAFPFASRSTAFHVLTDWSGNNAILMGGVGDPTNYYRQTTHAFQSISGTTTFARITTAGIGLRSTAAAFDLIIARPSTAFTANRTFTITIGDANRLLQLGGDHVTSGAFTLSGSFGFTGTLTGTTAITFPTTGTLATLAGSETLTGKTLTAPDINGGTADSFTSLSFRSTGAAFDMKLATAEAISADRTLSFVLGNTNRTLTMTGNASITGTNTGDQTLKSTMLFHTAASVPAGSTIFFTVFNGGNENLVTIPVPCAGTARNLRVRAGAAPVGAETFTYRVRKNSADAALTCSITGAATTGSDVANTESFAAGDTIDIRLATSGGAAATYHSGSIEFDPS